MQRTSCVDAADTAESLTNRMPANEGVRAGTALASPCGARALRGVTSRRVRGRALRVTERAACWPLEVSEREAGESFTIVRRAHSVVRRCKRNGSRIGIGVSVGSIGMWEVSVVVVRSSKLLNWCEMSTTTAPTPRISILDGVGKSVRCAGMVRTQRGITMVIRLVGMVLSTVIVVCEKRHGRGVRVSR